MRLLAVGLLSAVAIAWAASWSLTPYKVPPPQLAEFSAPTEESRASDATALAALDAEVFQAQIWTPPPPPPPPPAEPAPQLVKEAPPPELLLLAITHDGERRVAALYDKRRNQVVLAEVGDALTDVTVTDITESAVELAWSGRTSRLLLRKDES